MGDLKIRDVPDDVIQALRLRAAKNGRSTEAEVRAILSDALIPEQRLRMGDALASLGRAFDLDDDDIASLDAVRDRTPSEPPPQP